MAAGRSINEVAMSDSTSALSFALGTFSVAGAPPFPGLNLGVSAMGSAKPSSTTSDVVRDGWAAANSAAGASVPATAMRTASSLPRSSSTAVMLSAHCSKVGIASGAMGSDAPVPG